ncbi:hypothetical protein IJJ18_02620 [Candidatus Saccharibacteria bacterium]|nr:hypothetical protein [Candidatus Saccharibacteria bacterium]
MQENATITTAEVVDKVVDDLIAEKGLDKIQDGQKQELRRMLSEQLVKRINLAVLKELPDDKFEEFEKASKKKDVDFEELQDIVAGAGLDTEKIVEEVIQNFRKVVLDLDLEKEEA